jgi:hypothetical protein
MILLIRPKGIAIRKLERGPATEVRIIPFFKSLKFPGLIGTGFAQPNRKMINANRPIMSICFIGFRVSRPANFAVGSPIRSAIYPCEYSWMVKANRIGGRESKK